MSTQQKAGIAAASPILILLLAGFAVPLVVVGIYSLMPARSFGWSLELSLQNYRTALSDGYWINLAWSGLYATCTTLISVLLAWPTAKCLSKIANRRATFVTMLIALPIFISESVRLFGLSLFLMPSGGILAGSVEAVFGASMGSILNTGFAALLGFVYVHFPFVLFPLLLGFSLIDDDQIEAAKDLGASTWQVFREIELPLAMPGLVIGALFCFILSLGAYAEMTILGGQSVTVITRAIEQRFNYAQDWPLGAALTMLTILAAALIVIPLLRRIDIDRLIRR